VIARGNLLRIPQFVADVLRVVRVKESGLHRVIRVANQLMHRPENARARFVAIRRDRQETTGLPARRRRRAFRERRQDESIRRAIELIPEGEPTAAFSRTASDRLLLPAALSSAASAPVIWICQTLLAARGGISSVAVIGASIVWGQALLLVPSSLNQALLAELTHAVTSPVDSARRVFLLGWNTGIVSVLALLPVIVLAAPLITRLYGFQNPSTTLAFRLVVSAYAIQGITGAAIKVLESYGRIWIQLALNLVWAGAFIGLMLLWRSNGAVGFGWAAVAAFLIHATLVHLFAFYLLGQATHYRHV